MKIKSNFHLFKVEIQTQNQILFKNSIQITNDLVALFEKAGVMDMQGVGQLIKNYSYESDKEKTPDNSADLLTIPKKILSSSSFKAPPNPKYCDMDEQAKELCLNIWTMNEFHLAIH